MKSKSFSHENKQNVAKTKKKEKHEMFISKISTGYILMQEIVPTYARKKTLEIL